MAQTAGITLYETLGVEPTASQDEIRRAYRKLLRTAHPDSGGTVGMFRSIQHAYEVLSDPTQRSQYDAGPPHPPFSDPGPPAGHSTSDGESSNSKESSNQEPSADSEQSTASDSSARHGRNDAPSPMDDIPAPPDPGFPEPTFIPPEHPPERNTKAPTWTKIWAWVLGGIGVLLAAFQLVGMFATISFRNSAGGDSSTVIGDFMPRIVGTVIFFLIIALLPYVIFKFVRSRAPRVPLASDFIQSQYLRNQEFGIPGEGLSIARFGKRAQLGRTGEERTARVLREVALSIAPSARVIHGLRWPGKDHADIDHAILVGANLMLVDSKYMQDGNYWFDNVDLYRDGVQMDPFKLGFAVTAVRNRFPNLNVSGVVLIHSPTGNLARPPVELANVPARRLDDPNYVAVLAMNAKSFTQHLHRFVIGSNTNTVDTRLLADVLNLKQL